VASSSAPAPKAGTRPTAPGKLATREAVNARQSAIFAILSDLDLVIRKREYEPKHRTGFNLIDPLTGRDRRNRLGRPRKRLG
jgi:hypothetical protein